RELAKSCTMGDVSSRGCPDARSECALHLPTLDMSAVLMTLFAVSIAGALGMAFYGLRVLVGRWEQPRRFQYEAQSQGRPVAPTPGQVSGTVSELSGRFARGSIPPDFTAELELELDTDPAIPAPDLTRPEPVVQRGARYSVVRSSRR